MNVIEISHITKDYGQNRGVFDVSFSVKQGEVLGFLGPNGAGKTTTIRQLMGFIKPDKGRLSMKMFDLNASGKLKKMSKGMKQKIGIVCAFMNPLASILILDEPTSGLDPLMQNRFVELILSEKKKGKTILMSSHMFEEIERTCDRAAIIRDGRLVAVEEMEKLKEGRQKVIDITFREADMAEAFAAAFPEAVYQPGSKTVTAKVGKNLDAFIKKAGAYTVTDFDVRTQSLEEFFMHFYGEGAAKS